MSPFTHPEDEQVQRRCHFVYSFVGLISTQNMEDTLPTLKISRYSSTATAWAATPSRNSRRATTDFASASVNARCLRSL